MVNLFAHVRGGSSMGGVTTSKTSQAETLTLRPYQTEAIEYFTPYRSVLCADDMGLGKTVIAVKLDERRRQQQGHGVTLVIAPLTGVVDSWVRHFNEWAPDRKVLRIGGNDFHGNSVSKEQREAFVADIQQRKHDVYVLHWDALRLLWEELAKVDWLHVIADEAHKIKNRKTKTTKALKKIKKVTFKTALTGTPMENRPDELWSILHWLHNNKKEQVAMYGEDLAKYISSYWRFYNAFVDFYVIEPYGYHKINGPNNEKALMTMISPFYLRREKKVALPDLPDKVYSEYRVDLYPAQRRGYDQMHSLSIAWVGDHEDQPVVAPVVIAKFQRLQQFALASAEVVNGSVELREPSAKLTALLDIIEGTDKQVVVYSQFSRMINLVAARLEKEDISHFTLTGKTPQGKRTPGIRDFQAGKTKVFLATIKSGGVGIELFSSSTCVFLDRDWNPSVNVQAEDRLHRSGQKDSVQIIDIVANNTVDQGRKTKIDLKWSWIRQVLGALD